MKKSRKLQKKIKDMTSHTMLVNENTQYCKDINSFPYEIYKFKAIPVRKIPRFFVEHDIHADSKTHGDKSHKKGKNSLKRENEREQPYQL